MRLSAVWACYKVITEAVAQLPLILYDRISEDERRRASNPLASLLSTQWNDDQTQFEFVEQQQGVALFRKQAIAQVDWRGKWVEAVTPLHPDRVRRVPTQAGRRWEKLEDDGLTWSPLNDQDVFRVPGTPVLDYARDSFGMAQALELYAARSFAKGVRPAGFIAQDPGTKFSDDAKKKIKERIQENHGGSENAGGVLWLPEGLKWNQIGMTNQQAEFVATKSFTVADVSRWFRVPPYMLSLLESGTVSYASVSQQGVDFVVYTLMPWLTRWEQAIGRDLIVDDSLFAEFLTAEMLRGTAEERYGVYALALQWGIMSPNEVRRLENLNPREGGDIYYPPPNTAGATPEDGSPSAKLLQSLARDAADRVANRERKALGRGDESIFDDHAAFVSKALHIPLPDAEAYVDERRRSADAEPDANALVALALEGVA